MTPRPFYRSRLFWLGLLGLMFLLWGWWVSMDHFSQAGFFALGIGQVAGDVFAHWNFHGSPFGGGFSTQYYPPTGDTALLMKASLNTWPQSDPRWHLVFIPHSAVILAYVAGWLLTLAWWQRRKALLLKLHAAP